MQRTEEDTINKKYGNCYKIVLNAVREGREGAIIAVIAELDKGEGKGI
jgi:hypothetical protein